MKKINVTMRYDRIKGMQWIPFTLLFIGLVLKWMHVDRQGTLLNIGFVCFGFVALIDGIKGKHYKRLTIDMLKILLPSIIILLAAGNLVTGSSDYIILGVAILFQFVITQGRRPLLKGQ